MSLVFYYSPKSNATPVHWTLEELGVPYEKVRIDLQKREQRQRDFLRLNPNGKVPVLVHKGVAIFESVAIQIYLGETFGVDRGLFPAAGPQRGEALRWLVWCGVTLGEALSRFFRNNSDRFPAEQRNHKAAALAREEVVDLLRILDEGLHNRPYLLGGAFSIVDVHLVSWASYMRMFGIDIDSYTNLNPWLIRCCARPAHERGD